MILRPAIIKRLTPKCSLDNMNYINYFCKKDEK